MGILIRHALLLIALVTGLCVASPHASANAQDKPLQLVEQKIKAGLIYNFLKYTTWPQAGGHLQVCLLGGDPFDGYLSPLKGRTAQQSVIDITPIDNIGEAETCNMVIISRSQTNALPKLLEVLKSKHILTVSDIERFASQGGMVELSKEGQKINLYINKAAIDHAGLGVHDQMLKLAKLVSG